MGRWLVLTFLVGLALGVAGALLVPPRLDPYLPAAVRGPVERVEGEVIRKLKEPDRLLLTVLTPRGAILATFKTRLTEIDLLVEQGDTVTLALRRVEPFVEEPGIEQVRKAGRGEGVPKGSAPTPPAGAPPRT